MKVSVLVPCVLGIWEMEMKIPQGLLLNFASNSSSWVQPLPCSRLHVRTLCLLQPPGQRWGGGSRESRESNDNDGDGGGGTLSLLPTFPRFK